MQFFWLPSFITENPAPPREWRQVSIANSLEDVPVEGSTIILEILCSVDSERAVALLEQAPRSMAVWIYEPAASVSSSVSWMKFGASHVVSGLDDAELATDPFDTDSDSFATDSNKKEMAAPGTRSRIPGDRSATEPHAIRCGSPNMIGDSRSMRDIQAAIRMVGDRNCSVLIEGETGTGKEVVAREIHASGIRSRGPWVAVNCSAIPEPLLEAELFGYLKGAFTGAQQSRAGKFEAANQGTIFLDEIGDMPVGIQAKLLRVLQEREIERLGGNERVRLNIRVIAATNVDLAERVKDGRFRQDLYYRLNVFQISLPPLRDRPDDVAMLARHFVKKVCANERIALKSLDRSALDRLRAQSWPGNVRELENVIETAVIVSRDRAVIFASDLRFIRSAVVVADRARCVSLPAEGMDYQRALEDFEVALLTQALTRVRGNKTAAADLLGLKRTTLAAKMKSLEARFPLIAA
jgi:DNA-binding NtrC family response regulator